MWHLPKKSLILGNFSARKTPFWQSRLFFLYKELKSGIIFYSLTPVHIFNVKMQISLQNISLTFIHYRTARIHWAVSWYHFYMCVYVNGPFCFRQIKESFKNANLSVKNVHEALQGQTFRFWRIWNSRNYRNPRKK